MFPSCFGGNCGAAIGALADWKLDTNGATDGNAFPSVTLDLGFERADVTSVSLAARADGDLYQSQMLDVYFSRSKSLAQGSSTLCRANITFSKLGEALDVTCPTNTTVRYVIVVRSNANMVRAPRIVRAVWPAMLTAAPKHARTIAEQHAAAWGP